MRTTNNQKPVNRITELIWINILMLFFLTISIAKAQQPAPSGNAGEKQKSYLDAHPESKLTQLYYKDPTNRHVMNALRYSIILEQTDFDQRSETDKAAIKGLLKEHMEALEQISVYIDRGDSFELANRRYERNKTAGNNAQTKASAGNNNAPMFNPVY